MLKLNKTRLVHHLKVSQNAVRLLSAKSQPLSVEEYSEVAEYPEILDMTSDARKRRIKEAWHQQVQDLKTVEEKQIKINMPRYYGYKAVMLGDERVRYNSLPMAQHYTRTVLDGIDKVPGGTADQERVEALTKAVSSDVQDSVEYAAEYFKNKFGPAADLSPQQQENEFSQILVEEINRSLINSLSADCQHLHDVEIDLNPRHEAFWFVGGINPPNNVRKMRKGNDWSKDKENDPIDRAVQYVGEPYLAIRHKHLLPPLVTEDQYSDLEKAKNIPLFKFDARSLGYSSDNRHLTSIPGFWPGSSNQFGFISYQKRDYMLIKNAVWKPEDVQETLNAQGILSSFAWTLAQAYYQGFTTFNDLTYPINTQNVITNGKEWSFYHFQLNTTLVHSHLVAENPKVNHCWGTPEMKLFEEIDANGKCIGFNEEVVKNLVKMYSKAPVERTINLTPYLGETEKNAADISHDGRREFIENTFKYISSNRPRHLALPEIYNWEKIYKIDNKTRVMDPKRRFFEIGINPWARTLDQHCPEYIPKINRPGGVKSREKFKKTYYP